MLTEIRTPNLIALLISIPHSQNQIYEIDTNKKGWKESVTKRAAHITAKIRRPLEA